MNWYYAEGSQQLGPVTDAQLEELFRSGKITAETLVWRDGMANWQAYGQVRAATPPAGAPATGGVVCSQCGKIFPESDVIRYGEQAVCAVCKPAFVQRLKEGVSTTGQLQYAGFWIRLGAKMLDGIILTVPLGVLFLAFVFSGDRAQRSPGAAAGFQLLIQLIYYIATVCYNTFFIGKFGATPGKMACRLKVVMADGSPVTFGRASGRAFSEILSGIICNIGYIMAGFDDEKRALHDRICDTRVVRKD